MAAQISILLRLEESAQSAEPSDQPDGREDACVPLYFSHSLFSFDSEVVALDPVLD